MRLGISNLAWNIEEDTQIADLLKQHGITAIDIAPGKYFSDFSQTTPNQILSVKSKWLNHGIEITGMQALLFGTVGLNVFGDNHSQNLMLEHLAHVCRIASILGAPRLVFGSPKNRDRKDLSDIDAKKIATDFFRKLGDIAEQQDVFICLEPNPTCYGANFMRTHAETVEIVKSIDHASIKMQLDLGAVTINNEDLDKFLQQHSSFIGHIHASEPHLVPWGDHLTAQHSNMAELIKVNLPQHLVTIEMLSTQNETHIESVNRAIVNAKKHFLSEGFK